MSSASNTAFAYMENSSPPPAYLLTYSVGGLKGAGESLAEYHRNSFDFFHSGRMELLGFARCYKADNCQYFTQTAANCEK